MIKYVTAVKDDVVGDFTLFGEFPSVAAADRAFKMACSRDNNLPVSDLSLYIMCNYDCSTGVVNLSDVDYGNYPSFVSRGEKE